MATLYGVNAGGNWDAGGTWSTTAAKDASRTGGASAPTAADNCILDDYSGSVTNTGFGVCRSLDCTGYTGTLTLNASQELRFGDATGGPSNKTLVLVAGMTLTAAASSIMGFVTGSGSVQTINFASKTTGKVTFNATGSYQLLSGFTCPATSTVTLTKGTLDINGQTCSWGLFNSSNTNTRSLTLGAAAITMTGASANVFDLGGASGLTFSGASATITCSGAAARLGGNVAVLTYGTVNFTGSGLAGPASGSASGTTFTNLTRTGTAAKTDGLEFRTNFTISGTLTINGNSSINRILVSAPTVGSAVTITAATWSVTNTDFQDITGAGAGSRDFSARTDIGDCGGNLNITFPASVTQTATGTASFNWSDVSKWTTRVPLPQDDVVVANAFSASQFIGCDMPRLGRSIDFSGATGAVDLRMGTIAVSIYGSLALGSGLTVSGVNTLTLAGRGNYTITSAGKTFTQAITISAPTGTYTLQDALSCLNWTLSDGTFTDNGFSVTASQFLSNSGRTRVINWTGTWITNWVASGGMWTVTSTALTFNAGSGILLVTGVGGNTHTFAGGGLTYGTLTYTVAGSTGELDITGSNSFAAINFSDVTNARSLKFTNGTTTTIRNGNGFNVRGTSGKLMTIDTITGASTFTLTSPNQQSTDFITPTRSTVDASPKWYAGANSTDGTGNTNWIFTNSPESVNSFTQYTAQQCLNFIYGTPDTQYSLQEIANLYNGTPSTKLSFQEVLNHRDGLPPNARSAQEALFENVKTVLGLSDPYTQYSVQYLLNLCKARGIGLSTIFG